MANQRQAAQQEEKLSAILILESYTNNFKPFSIDRAECLMPMVGGKTILDHNLEYLVDNEVEEIYLFCTKHHKQIETHLDEKRWKDKVELHFLYSLDCQSLGDAIRKIDEKGLVSANFVMLTATGIISNLKLKEYLDKHRQTSKADKNAIMTVLCLDKQNADFKSSCCLSHTNKNHTDTLIVHNESQRILQYDQVNMADCKKNSTKYVEIPDEFLDMVVKESKASIASPIESANARLLGNESSMLKLAQGIHGSKFQKDKLVRTMQTHTNLLETQIYICSPYVLHLFTDNFDCQNMKEFIRGVLVDQDVTGYTIYIDVIKRKFGTHFSQITDLNSYYFETMRLLQRTELILRPKERANFVRLMDKLNVFVHKKSLRSGENYNMERNVLVDANCHVGDNATLVNCYIGANVKLGKNVKLSNCIVLSNAVICDGVVANGVLFGHNVRIGVNCKICENVLFSNNCKVRNGTAIKQRGCLISNNTKFEPEKAATEKAMSDKKSSAKSAKGAHAEDSLEALSKGFNEENYSVYILSDRYDENDDGDDADDDFGDSDGDTLEHEHAHNDSDDSDDSDDEGGEATMDTSKNGHFLVLKKLKSSRLPNEQTAKKSAKAVAAAAAASKGKGSSKQSNEDEYEESFNANEPRGQFYDSLDELESSEYSESSEDDDDDDSDESGDDDEGGSDAAGGDSGSDDDEDDDPTSNRTKDVLVFYNEVVEILQRGLDKNLNCDNLVLEINSCKHAYYIPIADVCFHLARAIFRLPLISSSRKGSASVTSPSAATGVKSGAEYLDTLKSWSKKLLPLIQNYFTRTKESQLVFLDSLLDFVVNEKPIVSVDLSQQVELVDTIFVKMLHYFFNDLEFLEQDNVLEWYQKHKQSLSGAAAAAAASEKKVKAIGKLEPFIAWLQEDSDDEEEDDDDDE